MIKMRNGAPVLPPDARGPILSARAERFPDEFSTMLQAELLTLVGSLGVVLDGSETKADLIGIVERLRRRSP
jgi:hypothetical protein